jgi:large subunit ribosomal protein L18
LAKGPQYRVPYRRRRENKTDYKARRILATSKNPRFVVRISNKKILVQITEAEIEGDYVLVSTDSSELAENYGWKASGKNTPAAYLLGLLTGYKALEEAITSANLDIGLKRPTPGSRVFAVVKGANDAGLSISMDSDVSPSPDRIDGTFIKNYAENIKDPFKYEALFSSYLRSGIRPENIPELFNDVKNRIEESY